MKYIFKIIKPFQLWAGIIATIESYNCGDDWKLLLLYLVIAWINFECVLLWLKGEIKYEK